MQVSYRVERKGEQRPGQALFFNAPVGNWGQGIEKNVVLLEVEVPTVKFVGLECGKKAGSVEGKPWGLTANKTIGF